MLYQKVSDYIEELINSGTLSPGERVPAVKELCEKFQVSHITVLRAYQELSQKENIIKKGKFYIVPYPGGHTFALPSAPVCLLTRPVIPSNTVNNYTNDINAGISLELMRCRCSIYRPSECLLLSTQGAWHQHNPETLPAIISSALKVGCCCSGFIFDPRIPDDTIEYILSRSNKPGIVVDRTTQSSADAVCPDNSRAVSIACETAFRYGYRSFLYIRNSDTSHWNASARDEAFNAFAREKLAPGDYACAWDWNALPDDEIIPLLYKSFDALKKRKKPVAVITSFDHFARPCIELLTAHGAVIGRDYGLISVGGGISVVSSAPKVTAVKLDAVELGSMAAKLLCLRVGKRSKIPQVLSPEPLLFLGETL